jgi:exonuclease SbcC
LRDQEALGGRVDQLQAALERVAELTDERNQKSAQHGLHCELALALRSDRFQSYLLTEAFDHLVQGASRTLFELSDQRYTLDVSDDEFRVVDHDNACETRSADTLSGGETFLASLALALQLSEQVQHAAGAVRLDSIFIDEGFGSLDSETLETVAGAIEALRDSSRTVGIITHVRPLAARMPMRIDVEKSPSGSRAQVAEA